MDSAPISSTNGLRSSQSIPLRSSLSVQLGGSSLMETPMRSFIGSVPKSRRQRSSTVNADSEAKLPRLKVVIVGEYAVGKTSLIRQLTQRHFSPITGATIGVEFQEYTVREEGRGGSSRGKAMLQLWDVAGQQYFSGMTRQYYRWAAGVVVCADVTRRSTFDAALEWYRDVLEKTGALSAPRSSASQASFSPSPAAPVATSVQELAVEEEADGVPVNTDEVSLHEQLSPSSSAAALPLVAKTPAHNFKDEPSISVFLVATKADLHSQVEMTVQEIYEYARENGFTDVLITSATDYSSVRDAFEHITDVLLEQRDKLYGNSSILCMGGDIEDRQGKTTNLARRRLFTLDSPVSQQENLRSGCCS